MALQDVLSMVRKRCHFAVKAAKKCELEHYKRACGLEVAINSKRQPEIALSSLNNRYLKLKWRHYKPKVHYYWATRAPIGAQLPRLLQDAI